MVSRFSLKSLTFLHSIQSVTGESWSMSSDNANKFSFAGGFNFDPKHGGAIDVELDSKTAARRG